MAMLNNQMVTHRFWPIPKYPCRPRSFPCKCPRDFPIIFHHIFIGVPWCSRFFIGISDVHHMFCPYFPLPGGFKTHALPSPDAPEEIQVASQQQVLEDGTWCREQQLLFRPGRTEASGKGCEMWPVLGGDWNMAFIMGIWWLIIWWL